MWKIVLLSRHRNCMSVVCCYCIERYNSPFFLLCSIFYMTCEITRVQRNSVQRLYEVYRVFNNDCTLSIASYSYNVSCYTMLCYAVLWRISWKLDAVWLHICILAWRSTSLILSGSRCCHLKVVRYRSSNCWMISTICSTTSYHVTMSIRSVMSCDHTIKGIIAVDKRIACAKHDVL